MMVSLVLLGVSFHFLDWQALNRILLDVSVWRLGLAVCVSFCQFTIMSLRWHHLIKKRVSLSPGEHLTHYFYSVFLNTFTPANLGGDVYRLLALEANKAGRSSVIALLLQERLLGLMAFFLFYLVCLGGSWAVQPEVLSAGGGLFIFGGGCILAGVIGLLVLPFMLDRLATWKLKRFSRWYTTTVKTLGAAIRFDSLASFIKLMGCSFVAVSIWVTTVQILAVDLGLQVPWLTLGLIAVLVELIRLLPLSIQGIGVREGAYAYLFGVLGKSTEAGFMVGTMSYLALSLSILMAGGVGFVCLVVTRQHRHPGNQPPL
jgi:uncharacterized protein (TIRG00374 family)